MIFNSGGGGKEPKLLWSNADTTSEFPAYTEETGALPVPGLTQYKWYRVVCAYGNNSENNRSITSTNEAPIDKACKVSMAGISYFCTRNFTPNGDGLYISDGLYMGAAQNGYCIPIAVYGL